MRAYFFLLFILFPIFSYSQIDINGSLERINPATKMPQGWWFGSNKVLESYPATLDSSIKSDGKYSVSIEKVKDGAEFGMASFLIPHTFEGKEVEVRAFIKTSNVVGGTANIFIRLDGTTENVGFANLGLSAITGTTDWKEYSVKLKYNEDKAININSGIILSGNGKIWFDNVRVFIDGKPINEVPIKQRVLSKTELDTVFSKGSKIDTIILNKQKIVNISTLGQLWAFLKYHHPAVIKGDYNWDAELFRILPAILETKNNKELSNALELFVNKLGVPEIRKDAIPPSTSDSIKMLPNYGDLLSNRVLNKSLTDKLESILNNPTISESYYVKLAEAGNPAFENENAYPQMSYPDVGYRLVSLFRYWGMINYFFPYKYLIEDDWTQVLNDFIPSFVLAKNSSDYSLAALKLIGTIKDTHANIWNENPALRKFKGEFRFPFEAKFVENSLIITSILKDSLNTKNRLEIGDNIVSINGISIKTLITENLPYTPASNYPTQLRDLPSNHLLRTNSRRNILEIIRDGATLKISYDAIELNKVKFDSFVGEEKKGYSLLNDDIGYIYAGKFKNSELDDLKKLFASTKGLIIDLRTYPSDFMPFTVGNYIKSSPSTFVKFTLGSISRPGLFTYKVKISNGSNDLDSYKGKVVVIVNESTQSQGEYTTMAFQSSPNVTVIGSTTAGADGNYSQIVLPGGLLTGISGIGVYYPDGGETQQIGVRIDTVVMPTISGIKAGKDELLEKAMDIILSK